MPTRIEQKDIEAYLLKQEHEDLRHTFRKLTKAEIAAQYPPEKVEALLTQAQKNAKAMSGPIPDMITEKYGMSLSC
jgi:hypothetical protein